MAFKPELGLDRYGLQARLAPAVIVLLPVGALLGVWLHVQSFSALPSMVLAIAATYGIATLLVQLGRDLGKQKEPALYCRWGGKPSTVHLRHRARAFTPLSLARYHRRLGELMREIRLPSPEEERADPATADAVYESCGDYLRAKTQDTSKYQRLFGDNINFGFRRNLWAMKPIALVLATLCLTASFLALGLALREGKPLPSGWLVSALIDLVLLACWLAIIQPDWVRLPADEYARQLIACCEELEPAPAASRIVLPE